MILRQERARWRDTYKDTYVGTARLYKGMGGIHRLFSHVH